MTYYFTADPHFMHKRINELTGRPFEDEVSMSETLLKNFNDTVSPDDTLVILGDVCMGKIDTSLGYLSRLTAGHVIILPGNHDRWSLAYGHKGTEEVADQKRAEWLLKYEDANMNLICMTDRKPSQWLGEEFLSTGHVLSGAMFSHYPAAGDSHDGDRYEELRPITWRPIIHGHVHEKWRTNGRHFNVGVDVNGFMPVHEDVLIEWAETQKP